MNQEDRIIELYLCIDAAYGAVVGDKPLRQRGSAPGLSDAEVLTIEIFGEWSGHHEEKAIYRYIKHHWLAWFPALPHHQNFRRQCANLRWIKQRILEHLWPLGDMHVIDGVPLPLCQFARALRCRRMREDAAYGHCAAKQMTFWGFKGYPLMRMDGAIAAFWSMPANEDERSVLDYVIGKVRGMMLGDKGFQCKEIRRHELESHAVHLLVPARKNMKQIMSKAAENQLKNLRRLIETAIGQLTERYDLSRIKARSPLAFFAAIFRKILAYNLKLRYA
jgi:Transposase DDE domain